MFDECVIRGRRFAPARFCGPLVGFTHSAFRRLVADLGGSGALWTEMLAARQILKEDFSESTWVRRREQETSLFYQLMVNADDPIEQVLERLEQNGVDALDLNLACSAGSVRFLKAGCNLFEDINSLRMMLERIRKVWPHVFTVKIRLGHERPDWKPRFIERLRLLEDSGVDAVILHPRFFEDRFKRRARHELYPWVTSLTRLPIIANGDISGPETLRERPDDFQSVQGVMLGRMAVARPWIFSTWEHPVEVDMAAIWNRMCSHVMEDFPPVVALRKMQMFNRYFSVNFKFGHQFIIEMARAVSIDDLRGKAEVFFSHDITLANQPTVNAL